MLHNAVYNVIVLCNAVLTSVLMFYWYFSRHMPFSSFVFKKKLEILIRGIMDHM